MKNDKNKKSDRNYYNNKNTTVVSNLQKGPDITTIYIGNLSFTKREGEVKKLFQKFGKVTYVRNILDAKTGHNRGFSFVQMPNREDALKAIEHLNGKVVDDRTLKVSIAQEDAEDFKSTGKKFVKGKPSATKNEEKPTEKKMEQRVPRKRQKKGLDLLFEHLKK